MTSEEEAFVKLEQAFDLVEVRLDWFNCDQATIELIEARNLILKMIKNIPKGYVFK